MLDQRIVKEISLEPDGMKWPAKFICMGSQENDEEEEKDEHGKAQWFFKPEGPYRSGDENRQMAVCVLGEDDSDNEDLDNLITSDLSNVAGGKKWYSKLRGYNEHNSEGTVSRSFQSSKTLVSRATPMLNPSKEQVQRSQDVMAAALAANDTHAQANAKRNAVLAEAITVEMNPVARVFFDIQVVRDKEKAKSQVMSKRHDKDKNPEKSGSGADMHADLTMEAEDEIDTQIAQLEDDDLRYKTPERPQDQNRDRPLAPDRGEGKPKPRYNASQQKGSPEKGAILKLVQWLSDHEAQDEETLKESSTELSQKEQTKQKTLLELHKFLRRVMVFKADARNSAWQSATQVFLALRLLFDNSSDSITQSQHDSVSSEVSGADSAAHSGSVS